jgi:hypothetical protein
MLVTFSVQGAQLIGSYRDLNLKYPFTKYLKWKNNKYFSHFREIGGIQHQCSK